MAKTTKEKSKQKKTLTKKEREEQAEKERVNKLFADKEKEIGRELTEFEKRSVLLEDEDEKKKPVLMKTRPRLIKTPEEMYEHWQDYTAIVDKKKREGYSRAGFTMYMRKELFHSLKMNTQYLYSVSEEFKEVLAVIDEEILVQNLKLADTNFNGGTAMRLKNQNGWKDRPNDDVEEKKDNLNHISDDVLKAILDDK